MKPRKSPRFKVFFCTSFSAKNKVQGDGIVTDLTPQGCRVASETSVPIGTTLDMRIDLDTKKSPIEIPRGVVRWSSESEFGLEFLVIEPQGFDTVRRFLDSLETVSLGQRG